MPKMIQSHQIASIFFVKDIIDVEHLSEFVAITEVHESERGHLIEHFMK